MMISRWIHVAVGGFVFLGILSFIWMALNVSNFDSVGGDATIHVSAEFDNIGSLKTKAPVTLAGVKLGRVERIYINPQTYEAVVEMSISTALPLPEDTSVSILTSGLVGEQYIALEPGGSSNNLEDGDEIRLAQSALVLEKLIGQFLTSMGSK